jgi:NADPH2:quinone reductase
MKAIQVRAFGDPEVMELATVPDPTPGPGQVVVSVMAAGVNPVDTYIRSGNYGRLPELPYTPGSDGAGVVFVVGPGVPARLRPGLRVWVAGSRTGTYAEAAVCDATNVFALPEQASFAQGAALGIPYSTAYRALFQRGAANPGETVLIHGATGGVGVAAAQFARAAGLRVLATGGSEPGRRMLAGLGLSEVFDHTAAGYMDEILKATDGQGVDLVIEMLANVNLAKDLTVLGRSGRVVVVGSRGSIELSPRELMVRDADIRGVMISNTPASELAKCHAAIGAGMEAGFIKPLISRIFELREAATAHRAILAAGHEGKIVLQINGDR